MKVLIYTGYQKVPFNKTTWKEFGTGGTEYSAIKLADYLFSEGHTVIVSGEVISEVANGVIYQNIREIETHQHFDVVIATSYIHYIKLLEDLNITYDKSFFWIHNEAFYPWYNGESLPNNGMDYLTDSRLTKVVAVSHYHKLMLETTYPQIKDKLVVIENAIDPFDWGDIKVKKIENKFIYTSAADRGLSNLLKIWPKIKEKIPNASLWVATPPYGLEWYDTYKVDLPDVNFIGNLSPTELYTHIKSSDYWLYPSQYNETYCITALEMMYGKVKIVSTDTGNLMNLLSGRASLISTPSDEVLLQDQIFKEFEYLYNNKTLQLETIYNSHEYAKKQGWSVRVESWIKLMNIGNKLHPELYSYFENKEVWKSKFLTYSVRTKEWDLITDEPFDNCFTFPLFTEDFCRMIREEAENCKCWTTDRHDNYPTTDMLISMIGMDEIYNDVLKEYIMQFSIYMWALEGKGWDSLRSENFLAKYVPNAQGHLSIHHDMSDITCLVQLSAEDEYEGGGTYFRRQKQLVKCPIGYCTIHPGNITHKHGARAVTKGTRYIVVSFMMNTER
jgi:hypothetical protein